MPPPLMEKNQFVLAPTAWDLTMGSGEKRWGLPPLEDRRSAKNFGEPLMWNAKIFFRPNFSLKKGCPKKGEVSKEQQPEAQIKLKVVS